MDENTAFKSCFLSPRKQLKSIQVLHETFSSTRVQTCLYTLFQNQHLHFLLSSFFQKYLNPQNRIKKMINEHTVDYHTSPSQLTSRIHPLIFLWTFRGSSLKIISLIFLKPVYLTMVAEKLQISGVKIGKYICDSKNWFCWFLLMPTSKDFSDDILFQQQKEGRIWS